MQTPSMVIFVLLALLIRVGHVLTAAGTVRSKNAGSIAARMMLDAALVVPGAFVVSRILQALLRWTGWASDASFGDSLSTLNEDALFRIFPVLLIAGGAIVGAVAERSRWRVALVVSVITSCIVMPLLLEVFAQGWLAPGHYDGPAGTFARDVWVRDVRPALAACALAAGSAALAAAWRVGPRKGKYNRDLSVNHVPAHNLPLVSAGGACNVVGWLALIALTGPASRPIESTALGVLLCVSTAAVTAAALTRRWYHKPDVHLTYSAAAAALIASSVGAGVVDSWWLIGVGAVVGVCLPWVVIRIETRLRVDDVTSAAAVHLVGPVIGLILTALVAPGERVATLGVYGVLILLAVGAGAAGALAALALIASFGPLRLSESDEFDGTDLADLDVNGYPDFQQTTIKSYHAREV